MPSRSELPGKINRKKFIKALLRLDFIISKAGGKGNHYKIECPNSGKIITIQSDLRKDVLYYILNDIEKYCGITWDSIKNEPTFASEAEHLV
jgi:hypothetical protein